MDEDYVAYRYIHKTIENPEGIKRVVKRDVRFEFSVEDLRKYVAKICTFHYGEVSEVRVTMLNSERVEVVLVDADVELRDAWCAFEEKGDG